MVEVSAADIQLPSHKTFGSLNILKIVVRKVSLRLHTCGRIIIILCRINSRTHAECTQTLTQPAFIFSSRGIERDAK